MNDQFDLNETLDPKDWTAIRALGHRMMDEMMDYLENVRSGLRNGGSELGGKRTGL